MSDFATALDLEILALERRLTALRRARALYAGTALPPVETPEPITAPVTAPAPAARERRVRHDAWTAEQDALVVAMCAKGRTNAAIAQAVGRGADATAARLKLLRKKGVAIAVRAPGGCPASPSTPYTAEEDARITAMRAEGRTYVEIARALGRSDHAVRQRAMKLEERAEQAVTPAPVVAEPEPAPAAPVAPPARPVPVTPEGAGLGFGEALAAPTGGEMRRALAAHLDALGAGPADLALLERAVTLGGAALDAAEVDRVHALCRPIRRQVRRMTGGRPATRTINDTGGQAALVALLRERVAMWEAA